MGVPAGIIATLVGNLVQVIPQGAIGAIAIQATLEETGSDELTVTDHPVEAGAQITDHSFKRPASVVMHCGWSNAGFGAFTNLDTPVALFDGGQVSMGDYVSAIYSQLLALQAGRGLFTVQTSIRQYNNMLMSSVQLTRNQKTSQALMVTATFREVILVSTLSSTLPPTANQLDPASTADTSNLGVQNLTVGTPAPGGHGLGQLVGPP
jgi:hypothetical protein